MRGLLTELLSSMLLVLVVCGSCVGGDQYEAGVQLDDQANNVTACFLGTSDVQQSCESSLSLS